MRDPPEVVPLGGVLRPRVSVLLVLVGHERVADVDVEVGPALQGVRQAQLVHRGPGALIEVRIGLHGEHERVAALPLRVERALGVGRELLCVPGAGVEAVEVPRVGLQPLQHELRGQIRLERSRVGLLGELRGLGSECDEGFRGLVREHADRHRGVGGACEDHVERVVRRRAREHVLRAAPPFFLSWANAESKGAEDAATSAAANSPAQAINLRVTGASGYWSSSLSPLPPFFFGGGTAFGSYFGFGVGIWALTALR